LSLTLHTSITRKGNLPEREVLSLSLTVLLRERFTNPLWKPSDMLRKEAQEAWRETLRELGILEWKL
jgi:hypothetical protein